MNIFNRSSPTRDPELDIADLVIGQGPSQKTLLPASRCQGFGSRASEGEFGTLGFSQGSRASSPRLQKLQLKKVIVPDNLSEPQELLSPIQGEPQALAPWLQRGESPLGDEFAAIRQGQVKNTPDVKHDEVIITPTFQFPSVENRKAVSPSARAQNPPDEASKHYYLKVGQRRPLQVASGEGVADQDSNNIQKRMKLAVEDVAGVGQVKIIIPNEEGDSQARASSATGAPPSSRKKRARKESSKDTGLRKASGFKRTNDLKFLHQGYGELEDRMVEIRNLGKTNGEKSKQKQKLWNQVSSLKGRLRAREQALTLESHSKQKDSKVEGLLNQLLEVATPSQAQLISLIISEKWKEADRKAAERWPVDIREEGTLLRGKLHPGPSVPSSKTKTPNVLDRPSSFADLFLLIKSPEYIYKYFQPNAEQED